MVVKNWGRRVHSEYLTSHLHLLLDIGVLRDGDRRVERRRRQEADRRVRRRALHELVEVDEVGEGGRGGEEDLIDLALSEGVRDGGNARRVARHHRQPELPLRLVLRLSAAGDQTPDVLARIVSTRLLPGLVADTDEGRGAVKPRAGHEGERVRLSEEGRRQRDV